MNANPKGIVMKSNNIRHYVTIGTVQSVKKSFSSGKHEYEFSYVFENGSDIENCCRTPIFQLMVGNTQENWYMELDGFEHQNIFQLKRFSPIVDNLTVDLDITFCNAEGEVWDDVSDTFVSRLAAENKDFEWYTAYTKSLPVGENVESNTFVWPKNLLIFKGKLLISLPESSDLQSPEASVSSDKENRRELICDLTAMYRNGKSCDITFSVDGNELKAHKCFLESRSPVFAKMFADENIDQVNIENFDLHQFDCFLLFLYTGEVVDRSWNTVLALHSAAAKYQVSSLRELCNGILGAGLTVDNVCLVLEHSELFDDAVLKKQAKSFLLLCFSEIVLSDRWMHLMKEFPKLAIELISFVTGSKTRI